MIADPLILWCLFGALVTVYRLARWITAGPVCPNCGKTDALYDHPNTTALVCSRCRIKVK